MRKLAWITLFLLFFHLASFAGTWEEVRPDREMLRLMELLREWDLIKNLDFMQQLDTVGRMEETASEESFQKPQGGKAKDRQK